MNLAEADAYVGAAAQAVGLPIDPAHRPGVVAYFALAAEMAALVMAAPLGTDDEPAEAFVPIGADLTVRSGEERCDGETSTASTKATGDAR